MAVAVGYMLSYYLLSMRVGKLLAQAHAVPPELAAWSVAVLGVVAGVVLTWKALRE
jgi:lipopolysaccharide export LptBFGC system permease protein LptF